jgi:hypothetical protein
MFLKDSQVSIMPKFTTNDLGGNSAVYTSNLIGGKRKSNRRRRSTRRVRKDKRKTRKYNKR